MDYVTGKCGAICSNCPYYIGIIDKMTEEEYGRLDALSKEFYGFGLTKCSGCGDGKGESAGSIHITSKCKIRRCITRQDFDYCPACEKYPCKPFYSTTNLMYGAPEYNGIDKIYVDNLLEPSYLTKEEIRKINEKMTNRSSCGYGAKMKEDLEELSEGYYQKYVNGIKSFPENLTVPDLYVYGDQNVQLYYGLRKLHSSIETMYKDLLKSSPETYIEADEYEMSFDRLIKALWSMGQNGVLASGNSLNMKENVIYIDREKFLKDFKITAPKENEQVILEYLRKNGYSIILLQQNCRTQYRGIFDGYDSAIVWHESDAAEQQSVAHALVHYVNHLIFKYGAKAGYQVFERLDMNVYSAASAFSAPSVLEYDFHIDERYETPKYHPKVKAFRDDVYSYVDKGAIGQKEASDILLWSINMHPSASAIKRKVWISDIISRLSNSADSSLMDEILQSGCCCTADKKYKNQIKLAKETYSHTKPEEIGNAIENMNREFDGLFFRKVLKDNDIIEIINEEGCTCSFLTDIKETIPVEYCTCCAGRIKNNIKEIFNADADIKITESIKAGSSRCTALIYRIWYKNML